MLKSKMPKLLKIVALISIISLLVYIITTLNIFPSLLLPDKINKHLHFTALPGQENWRASEIHALMPFNNKLYVATGWAGGLYSIDEDFNVKLEAENPSPYDNFGKLWHKETDSILIGAYLVRKDGSIIDLRQKTGIGSIGVAFYTRDLTEPERYVLTGGWDGKVYRLDLESFKVSKVLDLAYELGVDRVNVQDACTRFGKLWLTSSYYAPGLYVWDGKTVKRVVEDIHFGNLFTLYETARNPLYIVGHDELSAILYVTDDGTTLHKYRLPKTHDLFNRFPIARFRIISSFKVLAYIHGIIYELPFEPYTTPGTPPIQLAQFIPRPIATPLWLIFDFCSFHGLLAVGRSEGFPPEYHTAMPQSGLDFIKLEDLWSFGKPRGYGGVWKDTSIDAGETSDPFLIYGFDTKTLHLWTDTAGTFTIEVDPIGDGSWKIYDTVALSAGEYKPYIFPKEFNAIWVRVSFDTAAKVGAWFVLG